MCYHFGEDAADAPDVDRSRVELAAEQYLRRTIPQRDHLDHTHTHSSENYSTVQCSFYWSAKVAHTIRCDTVYLRALKS